MMRPGRAYPTTTWKTIRAFARVCARQHCVLLLGGRSVCDRCTNDLPAAHTSLTWWRPGEVMPACHPRAVQVFGRSGKAQSGPVLASPEGRRAWLGSDLIL